MEEEAAEEEDLGVEDPRFEDTTAELLPEEASAACLLEEAEGAPLLLLPLDLPDLLELCGEDMPDDESSFFSLCFFPIFNLIMMRGGG